MTKDTLIGKRRRQWVRTAGFAERNEGEQR